MGNTIENCKIKLRQLYEILKTYSHLNFTSNSLCSVIPLLHIVNTCTDSGTTKTYFRLSDVHTHKIKTNNSVNVQHTGEKYMTPTHTTVLDLPMLGNTNIIGHIIPQLKLASLLSIRTIVR